jgi:hypothetical protein
MAGQRSRRHQKKNESDDVMMTFRGHFGSSSSAERQVNSVFLLRPLLICRSPVFDVVREQVFIVAGSVLILSLYINHNTTLFLNH